MKYPLSCDTWGTEEVDAIQKVIKSGRYTMGEEVYAFEKQFAEYMDVPYAKMVNSGSSANLLMIGSAIYNPQYRLKPGDSVIVPAVSWSTTYFPLQQYGLKLIFCDVDLHTLNLDVEEVKKAVAAFKPAAVFTVNLLGNPSNLKELRSICEENDMHLFEDNCESFGAELDGKKTGALGDMGTHSFFFSHHLQTMEGGMILCHYEDEAQYIDSMRAHGWIRTLPNENFICKKTGDPFEDSFKFVLPGYSVRPLDMSGAIGQVQLSKWPAMMEERRKNAKYFKEKFKEIVITQAEHGTSSWFGFSVIHPDIDRKILTNALQAAQVEIRPIVAGNFLRNPVIRYLDYEVVGTLPNADTIHDHGFFLGNDSVDIKDKIDLAYDVINYELHSRGYQW
tara:strand:- start:16806 stop:17981 length:1176 start_codon:yes stop_codon:yes gene_type:complete